MNCFECEEKISPKRLRALVLLHGRIPDEPLCVKCQEKRDRRLGTKDLGDSLANNEWEGW